MIIIKEITTELRGEVEKIIEENWGSSIIVSRGKVHKVNVLPGFVAYYNNRIQGLITYTINNNECEIVLLDSFLENRGIGSRLLDKVIDTAREKNCKRIWLITTNDNIRAIRFYQRRDFNMVALYVNAVKEARKIKPEIPRTGYDGIPIKHEIEFEKKLL
jgi:GNAT superfamily N-acetyltransferase